MNKQKTAVKVEIGARCFNHIKKVVIVRTEKISLYKLKIAVQEEI